MTRARVFVALVVQVVVRVARRLVGPVLGLVALRVGVAVVGQWVTAVVAGPLVLGWVLARWAAIERRLDRHGRSATRPPAVIGHAPPAGSVEHVAFARALVAVSARYLALCEDQADDHVTSGEGWR
jgi:uncharacterized membrane protein YqgA involved in biofilm formation